MMKASLRYTALAGLALVAAWYCLTGYAMDASLAGSENYCCASRRAELWIAGGAVSIISTLFFAMAAWRGRRAR